MEEAVVRQLVDLNAAFYARFAGAFAASRATPQPGFDRLLACLPRLTSSVLDVGCGDGRFGRFLRARGVTVDYTGVDFSGELLARVSSDLTGQILSCDISRPGCLRDLGQFDLVVCLSTLQHIPGHINRSRLLGEIREHIRPGGTVVLANWQFLDSPRQRRKIRPWAECDLQPSDVEEGDYLLAWRRGGYGVRYVALLDAEATRALADAAGFTIVGQYRSDGREGDLNLYTIFVPS